MQHNGNIRFDVAQACVWLERMFEEFPELAEDYQLRVDTIEGETNVLGLLDQLITIERTSKALRTGLNAEITKLRERDDRIEHRQQTVRQLIMKLLEASNLRRSERPCATVSIAAGRQKVVITNEDDLPEQFVRVKREPNREEIWKSLRDGLAVPGATLSNGEPTLRIS